MSQNKKAIELLKSIDFTKPKEEVVEKSKTTKAPLPLPYDPFAGYRSVMTQTTRSHSSLKGPDGGTPITMDAMSSAAERPSSFQPQMYKSCNAHGIAYREGGACHPCTVQKSLACGSCGSPMEKGQGGVLMCKTCH
jgi:hypothetical protein